MTAKPYKFQAFVTLKSPEADLQPGKISRMAVRGEHHRTHGSHFFSALVSNSGDSSDWIGDNHAIVTVMLSGDDAGDYLAAGDHFALWRGHDIADGVVTRRLFA